LIKESAIVTYERHSLKSSLELQELMLQKLKNTVRNELMLEIEHKRKTLQRQDRQVEEF